MGFFRQIRDDDRNQKQLEINGLSTWEDSGKLPEPVPNEARYQAALRPDTSYLRGPPKWYTRRDSNP
ncbi:MAG: hypothetical protein CFE26_10395 [Verrucomicrobiales bacterium VVV1]|nr:MAG: hypothetical protein CFE26_10395 [Verrucomicrobiales bacterium VVV1]